MLRHLYTRWPPKARSNYLVNFRDAVNRHGGEATILHLPDIGVFGNTHFAFSNLNNVQIADLNVPGFGQSLTLT